MRDVRALGICLECINATEFVTLDAPLTPNKSCAKEIEYINLVRHTPACKAKEDVFSEASVCDKLVHGLPTKVFAIFRITALPYV